MPFGIPSTKDLQQSATEAGKALEAEAAQQVASVVVPALQAAFGELADAYDVVVTTSISFKRKA